MAKVDKDEFRELTHEVTRIFIQIKKEHQLGESNICQSLAKNFCHICWSMLNPQTKQLRSHLMTCIDTINGEKEFNRRRASNIDAIRLYEGQIPYILNKLEQTYNGLPTSFFEQETIKTSQALRKFLEALYSLLVSTNNQLTFSKPEFMNSLQS